MFSTLKMRGYRNDWSQSGCYEPAPYYLPTAYGPTYGKGGKLNIPDARDVMAELDELADNWETGELRRSITQELENLDDLEVLRQIAGLLA